MFNGRCITRIANGSSRPTGQAARQTGQRGQPRPRLLTWRAGALPCTPINTHKPRQYAQVYARQYAQVYSSRLCRVNGKPTQPCMLKHGKTSKAHISITVSDRPMMFFLLGRPRVGLTTATLALEVKVMSRSRVPNQMPTMRNQAHNSVTMSLGPRIIVARVGPRVGPMTLTSTLKVIPRSNAPNDSKVSANVSEVILGHPRASPSSLGQVAQNSQKCLQNSHFTSQFDQI